MCMCLGFGGVGGVGGEWVRGGVRSVCVCCESGLIV